MGDGWGEGVPLPYPEARALDILVSHFGGRMYPPDLFMSSTTHTAFRNLCDEGHVRKRMFGYEVTLSGRRLIRQVQSKRFGQLQDAFTLAARRRRS